MDFWIGFNAKKFVNCFAILVSNFDEIFHDVNFYDDTEIFAVEYKLPSHRYIGVCNQSDFEGQMDFWLGATQSFINKNMSNLKLMDRMYPTLMPLSFSPEYFYYDYIKRDFVWNFAQAVPKIFLGGIYHN